MIHGTSRPNAISYEPKTLLTSLQDNGAVLPLMTAPGRLARGQHAARSHLLVPEEARPGVCVPKPIFLLNKNIWGFCRLFTVFLLGTLR